MIDRRLLAFVYLYGCVVKNYPSSPISFQNIGSLLDRVDTARQRRDHTAMLVAGLRLLDEAQLVRLVDILGGVNTTRPPSSRSH